MNLPAGVAYVASPYSNKCAAIRVNRYIAVVDFMALALISPATQECFLYSPIVAWHEAASRNDLPTHHEFWLRQNAKIIDIATSLIVFAHDGWEESAGVKREIADFASKGILPVYADMDKAQGEIKLWTI